MLGGLSAYYKVRDHLGRRLNKCEEVVAAELRWDSVQHGRLILSHVWVM